MLILQCIFEGALGVSWILFWKNGGKEVSSPLGSLQQRLNGWTFFAPANCAAVVRFVSRIIVVVWWFIVFPCIHFLYSRNICNVPRRITLFFWEVLFLPSPFSIFIFLFLHLFPKQLMWQVHDLWCGRWEACTQHQTKHPAGRCSDFGRCLFVGCLWDGRSSRF